MRLRAIAIIATLLVVLAAALFYCFWMMPSQRSVAQAIERCLGMPVEACDIVSNLLLAAESGGDVSLDVIHQSLKEKKATQNLLAGILFMRWEADLDVEFVITESFPRAMLDNLTVDSNKMLLLVRPEHIGVVETRQEPDGTINGSFDWTIDGLMKGMCNFIYETGDIVYLGVARRNSLGIYDSQHIFYRSYDFDDLRWWQIRYYYAVVRLDSIDTLRDAFRNTSFEQWLLQRGHALQETPPTLFLQGLDAGYAVVMTTTPQGLETAVDALVDEFGVALCGKEILLRESRSTACEMKELQALVNRHRVKRGSQENPKNRNGIR
ncbi:MAG: hypothetical protein ACOX9C_06345 [Kiritimatiellia bacterium]|jgi:hypothetical protein